MTISKARQVALGLAFAFATPTLAHAQDTLAKAKEFYASASYEEALQVLGRLDVAEASTKPAEVVSYQVFCLVALGRSDEAKTAIAALVRTDPVYHPSETEASPRVRSLFEDVRRPMLPEVVRQSYAKAREWYDRKEMTVALPEFDRVIALIDELSALDDQSTGDLRTVAVGFRDLTRAAIATPAPKPKVEEPAAPPATAAPTEPKTYGASDSTVSRPLALTRPLPVWSPPSTETIRDFRGTLELVVDETGKVVSAVVTKMVYPGYDAQLVKTAKTWTFRPAMKDGTAVRYHFAMEIHLTR